MNLKWITEGCDSFIEKADAGRVRFILRAYMHALMNRVELIRHLQGVRRKLCIIGRVRHGGLGVSAMDLKKVLDQTVRELWALNFNLMSSVDVDVYLLELEELILDYQEVLVSELMCMRCVRKREVNKKVLKVPEIEIKVRHQNVLSLSHFGCIWR